MKTVSYYEETQALMQTFSQEDQVYFQDLWDYFNLAGFLYKEEALREQVYNLAVDFSQAGADGLTAKDYFGLDPKIMADQSSPCAQTTSLFDRHHFGTPSNWATLLSPSSPHFCRRKVEKSNPCGNRFGSGILFFQ